jgi:molecular chaperone GrpE
MSDEKKVPDEAEPAFEAEAEKGRPEGLFGEGVPDIPASQWSEIVAVLQADADQQKAEADGAKADAAKWKEQVLRERAELENYRKRAEREREETAKYAISKFAKDVAGVADNFQRAISAVPANAAEQDPALKSFLEGVTVAEREFLGVLERHGVLQINPLGAPFNPHQHQAVMEREDASVPAGTVLQVFQAGFMIEDRCLRPAMVVVSTGGAKASKAGAGEAAQASESQGSAARPDRKDDDTSGEPKG